MIRVQTTVVNMTFDNILVSGRFQTGRIIIDFRDYFNDHKMTQGKHNTDYVPENFEDSFQLIVNETNVRVCVIGNKHM